MANPNVVVNWFEIPAEDVSRAASFYEAIFETKLGTMPGPEGEIRTFANGDTPTGCVSRSSHNRPSKTGTLIFLGVPGAVSDVAGRVESSGGLLTMPSTSLGPHGYMAQFVDTEGNRVALHGNEE